MVGAKNPSFQSYSSGNSTFSFPSNKSDETHFLSKHLKDDLSLNKKKAVKSQSNSEKSSNLSFKSYLEEDKSSSQSLKSVEKLIDLD